MAHFVYTVLKRYTVFLAGAHDRAGQFVENFPV